jgi:phenylacetate-CoA ligase
MRASWPAARLLLGRDRLPADLDAVVDAGLRRTLRHAGTTVPWYRRLFAEAGIDPRRAGPDDLRRLPVTRKAHWRDRLGTEFFSDRLPRFSRWSTSSGTTGPVVAMPFGASDRLVRRVATHRAFWSAGVGLGSRYAWMRSRPHRHRRWYQRMGVWRMLYVELLTPPERWWADVLAWDPHGLLGFPLETEALATRILDGRLPRLRRPVVCALYGEHLDARARAAVEAGLGPVRELYGSVEGGTIAWECGAGDAMHVNADLVVVELLRDGRPVTPGTPGEVVITNLHSQARPIVRFGQGDLAREVAGPCPCGRPGPLLRVEPGFRLPPLSLPSGRRVSARFFTQALPSPGWLVRWNVEHPERDLIRMVLTTSRPVPDEELRRLEREIAGAAWEPVRVEVRAGAVASPGVPFVDAPGPSGRG